MVVTAQRGQVWVSIQPPFTWEGIMDPEKVEVLIRTLAQAKEAAMEQSRRSLDVASLPTSSRRTGERLAGVER